MFKIMIRHHELDLLLNKTYSYFKPVLIYESHFKIFQ